MRDCENCKHRKENGCEKWECEFEPKMTIEQAAKWLDAIKEKYIHGGDDEMDAKRKEAIDIAIRSLEAWCRIKNKLNIVNGCGDFIATSDVMEMIDKALGEVGEKDGRM